MSVKPEELPGVPDNGGPPVYNTGVQQQPVHHQPMTYQPQQYGGPPVVGHQPSTNTTVIINQQAPMRPALRQWSSGLFSCFEDGMICALAFFCPECFACHLASQAGESCCLPCCVPGWLVSLRAHIRGRHQIEGSIMSDCCTVGCCYQCAMCQLARELKTAKSNGQY
ncbi:cornifelin homolog A-like [Patella vulgata]|uniref:cornifelin homolog A-like n=1 Tax=Patella vulgata TaxID=6465 RepID=UPI0024A8AB7C|nr:cornifelin homolog A-like [Patella vulgata]